jgi:predicted nucleic acid-binding Zn ribbon protein
MKIPSASRRRTRETEVTWRRVFMLLILGILIGMIVAFRH